MSSPGLEQLRSLQTRLNNLIDAYAESGPTLHALDEVGARVSFEPLDRHTAEISAALNEMQAVVLGDKMPYHRAIEFHVITCMNVAIEAHVEENLREASHRGSKSLTVDELAKPTSIDPTKLARCLRLLAAYHIFVETAPNVFARNRCSASFDSGAALDDLVKDPSTKYARLEGGFASMIGHLAEEGLRAGAFVSDSLQHSTGPRDYGFARAHGGRKIWEYFADGEHELQKKRFHHGFSVMNDYLGRNESVLLGFPWSTLPKGSVVCDVAGRTGNVSLEIAQSVSHLEFVVQDQESIIKSLSIPYWDAPEREPFKDRIKLVAHDFFDPQPTKGAAVYLVRMALHGFNDDQVAQVLSNLAAAASSDSKLVIVEAAYESMASPGADKTPCLLDLQMLTVINVRERLESQYVAIARVGGWKHVKTWKTGREGREDGVFRHYEFALA